jgi:hypothetical protein
MGPKGKEQQKLAYSTLFIRSMCFWPAKYLPKVSCCETKKLLRIFVKMNGVENTQYENKLLNRVT